MPVNAREEALAALRRWAATDRATLVAAAWQAGNRNVSELARIARVGRDAIYADLAVHHIDPRTAREEPTMPTDTTAPVELPVPGWRHPHLLSVHTRPTPRGTEYNFAIKPFTGQEPEPQVPQEWLGIHPTDGDGDRNWVRGQQRWTETNQVRKAWTQAHFEYRIGQLLRKRGGHSGRTPAEDWQTYADARQELRAAYAALDTTPDNMWRSALLRIVDAKKQAKTAANQWDERAREFDDLDSWLLSNIGEDDYPVDAISDAARKHGVDTIGWMIGPAGEQIARIIEDGDERIRHVAEMTGDDPR